MAPRATITTPFDGAQLGLDPRVAGFDLGGTGLLVQPSLAADFVLEMLDGIGREHQLAVDPGGVEASPQHAPRRAHERTALLVLLIPRVARRPARSEALRDGFAEHGLRRVAYSGQPLQPCTARRNVRNEREAGTNGSAVQVVSIAGLPVIAGRYPPWGPDMHPSVFEL